VAKKAYVARTERRSIGRFAEASTISGTAMTTSNAMIAITVAWTMLDDAPKDHSAAMRRRIRAAWNQRIPRAK
jgi:hypothetical protein